MVHSIGVLKIASGIPPGYAFYEQPSTMDYPLIAAGTPIRTVLNIDDSPANIKLIEQLIARRSDLKLISTMRGFRGIELACSLRPDVILLDINLPDRSGMQVIKVLLTTELTAKIPIIALSSNAYPNQIAEGLRAGFFAYLPKPFRIEVLMEQIDNAMRLSQSFGSLPE